jgi:PAS domain S-box-containing protein
MPEELNLFATTELETTLQALDGLNLIIELTGSPALRDTIYEKRPSGVSVIDHKATRLLWDLIQIEADKTHLEKERQAYQEKSRDQTQVILDSLPYRIMVVGMDMASKRSTGPSSRILGSFRGSDRKACYEVRYGLDRPCFEYGRTCFMTHRLDEIKTKGLISTYQEYEDERDKPVSMWSPSPPSMMRGRGRQLLEASRDVTDRIRLEREVQKSNTFFEKVIQSTVDGIVVVDTKGKVLIFNEGMENLTGYSAGRDHQQGPPEQLLQHRCGQRKYAKNEKRSIRSAGKTESHHHDHYHKGREGDPGHPSASLITIDGKEVGSVGVFTDMREVLKMRKELEDANIQLIQSQKIASIGRMAAGVAHEINNPLSAILIFAEMLKIA